MKRIVVGYDGSPASQSALMWATEIAERKGLPLELASVVDDDWGMAGGEWSDRAEHRAAVMISSTASTHQVSGGVSTSLLHGSIAGELASAVGVDDLLVLGSHKGGYTRGRAMGSLSARLVGSLRSSLLVVPEVPAVRDRKGVVLGIGPTFSEAAVRVATTEAVARHQPLLLVTAAVKPANDAALSMMQRAVRWIGEADAPVKVTQRILDRTASEALLDASRNAVLLVIGASSAPGGGAVAHDVLMNPLSAIWIAR